jgi:subtilisin family serine protease
MLYGCAFAVCLVTLSCVLSAEPQKCDPEVRIAFSRSPEANLIVLLSTQPDRNLVRTARSLHDAAIRRLKTGGDGPESLESQTRRLETEARHAVERKVDELCARERDSFATRLATLGATNIRPYRAVNAIAARIPYSALPSLEQDHAVARIGVDGVLQAQLDVSAAALGATAYWGAGYTGAGQHIALIDSGVDTTHPALVQAKIINGPVFSAGWFTPNLDNASSPNDYSPMGHGTQMAGILVGQGSTGFQSHLGVARGATLYNLKAAYATTESGVPVVKLPFSAMLAALDYAVLQTPAKVINISYGQGAYSTSSSAAAGLLVDEIANTYDVAIVMGFPNALEPAGALNAIVVGAMDDRNTITRADDIVAPTTPSSGVTRFPDLTAPGVNIIAPASNWEGAQADYGSVPGITTPVPIGPNTFLQVPSPSAAAAHVSGGLALLRQTGITDMLLAKAILINSTDGSTWTPASGWGYLNLASAKNPGSYYSTKGGHRGSIALAGPVDSGALSVTMVTPHGPASYLVVSDRRTGKAVYKGGGGSSGGGAVKVSLPNGYYLIQVDDLMNHGEYALAISRRGFEPVTIGRVAGELGLKYKCQGDAAVLLGSGFAVTCTVTNPWDIEAHGVIGRVSMDFPGSSQTTACTIDFGTVPGHGSRTQSCRALATQPGPQTVYVHFHQTNEYHNPDPEYNQPGYASYELNVLKGGITGKVVAQGANVPIADVLVTLTGPAQRVVKTNANGEFAFYELPPGVGPWTVTLSKSGYTFTPPSGVVPILPANLVPNLSFVGQANSIVNGNLKVVWNSGMDKEAITELYWKGGPNLTQTFYLDTCGPAGRPGNVEYFGNSMVPIDPLIGGHVLVGGGTDISSSSWMAVPPAGAQVHSTSKGCTPSSAGVPVITLYSVGAMQNAIDVERKFSFERAIPYAPFRSDFLPYVPRLTLNRGFTQVLYPATDGTLASVNVYACNFGCTGPVLSTGASPLPKPWMASKGWYAIHNPDTGQGVVVSRSSAADGSEVTAQLWVDYDLGSHSNATSFLLRSVQGDFPPNLTEKQRLLFYDSSTWVPTAAGHP